MVVNHRLDPPETNPTRSSGTLLFWLTISLLGCGVVVLVTGLATRERPTVIVSMLLTALAALALGLFQRSAGRHPRGRSCPDLDLAQSADESGPSYDDLDIQTILSILPQLERDELIALREHESRHRIRSEILAAIDQLLTGGADTPSGSCAGPTYDELDVETILPVLHHLERDELLVLRQHEASHEARPAVLSEIDGLLAGDGPSSA
jgi:hypothetical protein